MRQVRLYLTICLDRYVIKYKYRLSVVNVKHYALYKLRHASRAMFVDGQHLYLDGVLYVSIIVLFWHTDANAGMLGMLHAWDKLCMQHAGIPCRLHASHACMCNPRIMLYLASYPAC